jgi:NAD-dependent SIR2 family protein deacetylase
LFSGWLLFYKFSMMTLEAFADAIRQSREIVVFTGAGISTESGIPDFRSPGGIWSRYRPVTFQEFVSSEESRSVEATLGDLPGRQVRQAQYRPLFCSITL